MSLSATIVNKKRITGCNLMNLCNLLVTVSIYEFTGGKTIAFSLGQRNFSVARYDTSETATLHAPRDGFTDLGMFRMLHASY